MDPRIVGAHEGHAALAPQAPHHPTDAAFDDLDQRALAATVAIDLDYPGDDSVAVHQRTHLAGGKEQIDTPIVGPDEAVSVTVPDDAPGNQIHPIDESELPAAIADDLTITLHRTQPPLQSLLLDGGPERVGSGDSNECDRCANPPEEFDQGAAFGKIRNPCTDAARTIAARSFGAR